MSEEKRRPWVVVGLLLENTQHQFLLIRGTKWQGKLFIPGGKVEWGESIEDAAGREIKEEVGLSIHSLQFFTITEVRLMPEYNPDRHHVTLIHTAQTDAVPDEVVIDSNEAKEYVWLTLDEIMARNDLVKLDYDLFKQLKEKREEKDRLEEYKAGWQRAVADYKNLQKETGERRQLLLEMSEQQILEEFIPVYDNFKKAFASVDNADAGAADTADKKNQSWKQGIGYIKKQFGDILKAHKVEEIKTVGEKFDPKFHETVGEEEAPSTTLGVSAALSEHGTILKEVDGGYTMNGRVIKVAKVVISK